MDAADGDLRYLRDTWDGTITYTRGICRKNELWGWVDADLVGDTDTCRSHTAYFSMMNGGTILEKPPPRQYISFDFRI